MDFEQLHDINYYVTYNDLTNGNSTVTDTSVTNGNIVYKNTNISSQQVVGTDLVLNTGDMSSPNYATGVSGWAWKSNGDIEANNGVFRGVLSGATGTFSGTLSAGRIDIPNAINTDSFHVDFSGNAWWGSSVIGTAKAKVLKTGIATFQDCAIVGADIDSATRFASDTYNISANLVTPNSLTTKTMGFPIIFGDGRDGDVTIASGTTNVNSTKQYNTLTIESGGIVTSSTNKYIYIAVKGKLWIKSGGKVSMKGLGSVGGDTASGDNGDNGAGSGAGVEYFDLTTRAGASGGGGGSSGGVTAGAGGNGYSVGGTAGTTGNGGNGNPVPQNIKDRALLNNTFLLSMWGAGGGSGAINGGGNWTAGGAGGGCIYIECYELDIDEATTALDVSGNVGSNGTVAGGGGGGSGGCIFIRYHTLTNVTGDNSNLIISGGLGGTGIPTTGNGGTGGEGFKFLQLI